LSGERGAGKLILKISFFQLEEEIKCSARICDDERSAGPAGFECNGRTCKLIRSLNR